MSTPLPLGAKDSPLYHRGRCRLATGLLSTPSFAGVIRANKGSCATLVLIDPWLNTVLEHGPHAIKPFVVTH
jgi:hypothetical protein